MRRGMLLFSGLFCKKGIKKISKKGCQLEKFREIGASRPLKGRREAQKNFQGPLRE
jgi:hypothetical protein